MELAARPPPAEDKLPGPPFPVMHENPAPACPTVMLEEKVAPAALELLDTAWNHWKHAKMTAYRSDRQPVCACEAQSGAMGSDMHGWFM